MKSAYFARLAIFSILAFSACGDDTTSHPDMTVDAAVAPDLLSGPSAIGQACTTGGCQVCQGSCPTGELCLSDQIGFPGGYCTQSCTTRTCPSGSVCVPVGNGQKFCLAECGGGGCRAGYQCTMGLCLPPMAGDGVMPGTNPDGGACVQPIQDPSTGKGGSFGTDQEVSGGTGIVQAETQLAVDPATKNTVVAYIAIDQSSVASIGIAASGSDGTTFRTPYALPLDATVDMNTDQSDPVVAVDPTGNFYVSWVGFDRSTSSQLPQNMNIWVARSSDGGVSFGQLAMASPAGEWATGGFLDKPWVAVSPVDGTVYATWTRAVDMSSPIELRMARSTDGGKTWAAPITLNDANQRPAYQRNLCQVTVAADGSPVAAWLELGPSAIQFGDKENRVYLQRFAKDGSPVGNNVLVTGGSDSPTFEDPSVATFAGNVYVGFISGDPSGAWDVRVAASLDGGMTFQPSVKVNDDATCATHFHHQIAIDATGNVHAIWYDNRYHPNGNVFHAASPPAGAGAALAFGANTFVNDKSFEFTTSRSMSNWLGDYLGLTAVGNELYACWTDSRDNNLSHIFFAKAPLQ